VDLLGVEIEEDKGVTGEWRALPGLGAASTGELAD
jgi:hypothetical protein